MQTAHTAQLRQLVRQAPGRGLVARPGAEYYLETNKGKPLLLTRKRRRAGGGRAERWRLRKSRCRKQFFILQCSVKHSVTLARSSKTCSILRMKSLPLTARQVKATEAVLTRIYENAKLGLRGRTLALACDLRPEEYRLLCDLDPMAELAELKGRADAEKEMSNVVYLAARAGDSKAALEMLKHQHDWVAKQQVQVDTVQSISITFALEQAQARVQSIQADVIDAVDHKQPMTLPHATAEVRAAR